MAEPAVCGRRTFELPGEAGRIPRPSLVAAAQSAAALTVPFTETFAGGAAAWLNAPSSAVDLIATGGADGGAYVTYTADVADTLGFGGQTLFRCNATQNCSGGAFIGDWASNVGEFAFAIRHNAEAALGFFSRIATAGNFPAHAAVSTLLVQSNVWTEVSFAIDDGNPLLIPEFGTFAQTFSQVGTFQIGVSIPTGFTAEDVTFDLDLVSLAAPVPLPAAGWLLAPAALGLMRARRRR